METPLNGNMFQESAQSSVDRLSVMKDIEDIEKDKCMKCVGDQESIDQCCSITCHYFGEKDMLRNKLKTLRCVLVQKQRIIKEIMIDPETDLKNYLAGVEIAEYCFRVAIGDSKPILVTGVGDVSLTTAQIIALPSILTQF